MNQRANDGIKQFLEALSVDTEAPELEKDTKSCNRIIW